MPSITIQYKNKMVLQLLKDIARHLDFRIVEGEQKQKSKKTINGVPVTMSKKPDVGALFGVWKNDKLTSDKLRRAAWGDRV